MDSNLPTQYHVTPAVLRDGDAGGRGAGHQRGMINQARCLMKRDQVPKTREKGTRTKIGERERPQGGRGASEH